MDESQNPPNIFCYLALPCEAKPIVDYYRLKKNVNIHSFAVYSNDNICLTVTGIGKTAMAAGIAYTQALFSPNSHPIMLNIGIAGHKIYSIGSVFVIDKIIDADVERRFYPPLVFTPPCPTHSLVTISKPQVTYPNESLCDMEASAFYETSTRFTTSELIQCLKIISDNEASPSQNIQPKMVSELIAGHLSTIEKVLFELTALAKIAIEPELPEFDSILKQYRFTVSEQIQLKKLLSRWHLIKSHDCIDISAKTGKEYLLALKQHLDQAEFYL
jgi:adenosylhomocysteine nucleosidase